MPDRIDQREAIAAALKDFESYPFPNAAKRLFGSMGYSSTRTLDISTVEEFCRELDQKQVLTMREREALDQLISLHFLYQITDSELTSQGDLFDDAHKADGTRIHSYLFIAAELPEGVYTRTFLAGIARAINKPLAMPALVLFRHGDSISLAIIHRRLNKRQADRDVLEKATLIKDVRFEKPIRAHLEILNDFAFANLDADFSVHSFVTLHQAWQKRLDTFALNERFYREIADWYFWALHLIEKGKIVPPPHVDTDPERSLFLIRMLTRLIFCWFLQEKRLLPEDLFREHRLKILLKDFGMESSTFYRAVLQNLFFATLNQPAESEDGQPARGFRGRNPSGGRNPNRGIANLWRHEDDFRDSGVWVKLTASIPFLNGGLFECLDRVYQAVEETPNSRLDGFSDNPNESAHLPNDLFFGPERDYDLSSDYGEEKKRTARSKKAKVRGLIHILSRYKFTMEENTPLDEEIALDPELLGKVFENLLASFNPETQDTARKQTGSFYTPREVVTFMVDEALLAYLEPVLGGNDPGSRLRALFAATVDDYAPDLEEDEIERLVTALDEVKILDPACGSGAYPMGALHRLVDLLRKLDPQNRRWETRQRARLKQEKAKAEAQPDAKLREEALMDVAHREREMKPIFNAGHFDRDYARKLFLIENAIFGSDIQPVAVQIAKLRFFIALICDQKTNSRASNQGVLPLPNLETRIVAANTLMPISDQAKDGYTYAGDLFGRESSLLRGRLQEVRHEHFAARQPAAKRRCREKDAAIRKELANLLRREAHLDKKVAGMLADWDPYDQNSAAPFFDPAWMFGDAYLRGAKASEAGFDIVVGNPPYVRQEKIKDQKNDLKPYYADTFTGTADLYVYFYDRALQLLRQGGILSYISSNKWYRAAYGKKLRAHLGKTTTLLHAIDFGDAPVFTAIAYPTIVIARKIAPSAKHAFQALNWDPATPNTEIEKFAAFYFAKSARVAQSSLTADGWRFMARKGQDLLEKIRAAGTPLDEFVHKRFYYGIKTGLNEAFVVDRATRERLIAEDPKSKDLLKPYLRGRDIKRWHAISPDLWLIFTRHGTDISKYSAIKRHLAGFREGLEPKPKGWPIGKKWKGRKPGTYAWYEIQDNVAYWSEFETPKIITGRFMDKPTFCFDPNGFYHNNANSFIAGVEIWVAGVLNSPLVWYFLQRTCTALQNGFLQAHNENIAAIPIVAPNSAHIPVLCICCELVEFTYNIDSPSRSRDPLMRDYYEQILNAMVYELYLPDDLHTAGLHFFDLVLAAKLPRIDSKKKDVSAQLASLHRKFEELYAPNHPIRAALQKLHTLEPIRIIEGKA